MSKLILPSGYQRKLNVNITIHEGKLVIQFDQLVQDWVMELGEAAELLKHLNKQVKELHKLHRPNDYSLN